MSWEKRKRLPRSEFLRIENLALRHVYARKDNVLARNSQYSRRMRQLYGEQSTIEAINDAANIRTMVDPNFQRELP